jgi:hypothetical protein
MLVSGLIYNIFIGFMAAYIPLVWLLGSYNRDFFLFNIYLNLLGIGTLTTSVAITLFSISKPSMSYWDLEFSAMWLSVLGVDFVFPSGSLFIAKFALPHEQSMAGALFTAMTQVCFILLLFKFHVMIIFNADRLISLAMHSG